MAFNHSEIIGQQSNRIMWENAKMARDSGV